MTHKPILPGQHQHNELTPKTEFRLAKSVISVAGSLRAGKPEKALQQTILAGLKMASADVFHTEDANPLTIAAALKNIGIGTLAWEPETLMATLDQKYSGWTGEKIAEAIEYFHKTGTLKTNIPLLVRDKIHAIRVVATSNSAQTEWNIFEKVGAAFNDRVVKFGVVEPLTPGECARAVAVIENIRPDTYENEIKIYIAAACHQAGLVTVEPVKWIAMAEQHLVGMNRDSVGQDDPVLKHQIIARLDELKASKHTVIEVPDDTVSVQAARLLAIDHYAEEVL